MNADMFRAVANTIELEDRFDLNVFARWTTPDGSLGDSLWPNPDELVNDCRTVGCVAGWVNAITQHDCSDTEHAREMLGITMDQSDRLFYAWSDSVWADVADRFGWTVRSDGSVARWGQITAVEAAKVLRQIADGEITL